MIIGIVVVIVLFSMMFTDVFQEEEFEQIYISSLYARDLSTNIGDYVALETAGGTVSNITAGYSFSVYDDDTSGRMLSFRDNYSMEIYVSSMDSFVVYAEDYYVDIYNDTDGVPPDTMRFDLFAYRPEVSYTELESGDGFVENTTMVELMLIDGRRFNMTLTENNGTINIVIGSIGFNIDDYSDAGDYRYYLDDLDLFLVLNIVAYADGYFYYDYRFGESEFDQPTIMVYNMEYVRAMVLIPLVVFGGYVIIKTVGGGRRNR